MDIKRAKDIINSNMEIQVFYNNDSVWIKNIDENTGMASVENLSNNNELEVPVSKLKDENVPLEY